jgi:hypothetical protein
MGYGRSAWIAAAAVLLLHGAAAAESPNGRLARQERRIACGLAGGRIGYGDVYRLERDLDRIRRFQRAYRNDGHLGRVERRSLDRMLDRTGARLCRLDGGDGHRFERPSPRRRRPPSPRAGHRHRRPWPSRW